MALSGPDNWGAFRRRRHKLLPFSLVNSKTGRNTIYSNSPDWLTNAADNYSNTSSSEPVLNWDLPPSEYRQWNDEPDLIPLPNPSNWPDPGLWAGDERVWRGITIPQTPRKIAEPTVPINKAPTAKKGPTAPTAEERAEAWKQAMADAQGFMAPMQGGTIPGVAPGGGSREHQMSVYNTGGYDLTSNRPISDTDAVRKRLYGIMGFGR